jgi:hypothetical protein
MERKPQSFVNEQETLSQLRKVSRQLLVGEIAARPQ